jgi:hypothetical protein
MSEPVKPSTAARFPSWQSEVQAAVNETNPERMLDRVHAAEAAVFQRLQELAESASKDVEHQVESDLLAKAAEALRLLKRDRLGFPGWKQK